MNLGPKNIYIPVTFPSIGSSPANKIRIPQTNLCLVSLCFRFTRVNFRLRVPGMVNEHSAVGQREPTEFDTYTHSLFSSRSITIDVKNDFLLFRVFSLD